MHPDPFEALGQRDLTDIFFVIKGIIADRFHLPGNDHIDSGFLFFCRRLFFHSGRFFHSRRRIRLLFNCPRCSRIIITVQFHTTPESLLIDRLNAIRQVNINQGRTVIKRLFPDPVQCRRQTDTS